MRKLRLHLALCTMPLLLAACGDGWEAQRTTEAFPYGNQRTAGSGVIYVRAKMLPEKDVIVTQPQGYEEIKSGEEIFTKAQAKGVSSSETIKEEKKAATEVVKETEVAADGKTEEIQANSLKNDVSQEKSIEAKDVEPVKSENKGDKEKAALAPAAGEQKQPVLGKAETEGKVNKKTYEQSLDEKQNISDVKASTPEKVEPQSGNEGFDKQSSLISVPNTETLDIVSVPEEVKLGSRTSTQSVVPVAIRSPKMDIYNSRDFEAERSLEEIYSNPF